MSALLTSRPTTAGTLERAAVIALITEPEAPVSDAPAYAPQCVHHAYFLISPKVPKDPKAPKGR
ncbi:hypothetical protein AB0L74_34575 [Streptomyces sp. NPDC052020]|uniref:hypothetical protein n=1 Tax=Streptomyces sp. NPDC052020 TaxID=3155677 RepID=UPI00343E6DDF